MNHCIQVFTDIYSAEGTLIFLRKFGQYGQDDGKLYSNVAIDCLSDSVVYVAEADNQHVSVFSSKGRK